MTRRNATISACTNGDAMSYDVENRMTSMTTATGTTAFAYDGDGVRIKRATPNGTTYYFGNLFEVYVPNGGNPTFNKFYYFGMLRVAARINGTLFYMQGDHLGSSSLVMTNGGALNTRQTYFAYGAQRTTEGSALPTDYTFTGQKSDDSTGLMFYGARYYDTTLGRFTQADTIVPNAMDPQSFNRYSYVRNNPVNLVDPTGHEDEPPCQSWDDWCWENRYWTAQGKCYNESSQEWTRECAPTFSDPQIAIEAIALNPSLLDRRDVQFIGEQAQISRNLFYALLSIKNFLGATFRAGISQDKLPAPGLPFFKNLSAVGFQVSISGQLGTRGATGGYELIYNLNSGELSQFVYGGPQFGIGGELSLTISAVFIWNLPNNAQYDDGAFLTIGGGGSVWPDPPLVVAVSVFTNNINQWWDPCASTCGLTVGGGPGAGYSVWGSITTFACTFQFLPVPGPCP